MAGISQLAKHGVLNPVPGEIPTLMHTDLGRILGLFMQFPFGATNSYLISGLQRMDSGTAFGYLGMTGIAMFSITATNMLLGREQPKFDDLVFEGVMRAGIPGILERTNHLASQMSQGTLDIANLVGVENVFEKYGPFTGTASAFPAAGLLDRPAQQQGRIMKMLNGEPLTDTDKRQLIKRGPFGNHIVLNPVLQFFAGVSE
jgi:hypothetical protein